MMVHNHNPAVLYHAGHFQLDIGVPLRARPRTIKPHLIGLEDQLQSFNAMDYDRRCSFFASDDGAFTAAYLMKESVTPSERRLYRVEMPNPTRHPMILVHFMENAANQRLFSALANEYWNPTGSWSCLESIDYTMTVIGEEPWPDFMDIAGAKHRYGEDLTLAKAFIREQEARRTVRRPDV